MQSGCPGARLIKEPTPEYVTCPQCKAETEIWSDELRARCEQCQAWVYRQGGATCLDWCAQAELCVGASALATYQRGKEQGR